LINALFNRKIAKVSATPGKTRLVNFFNVDDKFYFVDLPGYGYAAVSKKERNQWQKMMNAYFNSRDNLNLVILLVDSRHKPTNLDFLMKEYLEALEIPYIVVGTKLDKLNQSEKAKAKKVIKETLELDDNVPIILTSAKEKINLDKVMSEILNAVSI
ncbi:ribosome biogenesis GTP-binding protein YihA/YsxC, partial [Hydrogenivirga sp. 128-5-R1-1]|uniref:ribosome biogenesis GTP-binding protein YihA/YsxC n=1 Tax=Hydrogenivirga sp. 128-5-R1-1 TaxID=392423 RepID=UPI00015F3687